MSYPTPAGDTRFLYATPGDTLAIRVPVDGVSAIPKATPVPSQSLVRALSEPSKKSCNSFKSSRLVLCPL